jgi:hypothetical protein
VSKEPKALTNIPSLKPDPILCPQLAESAFPSQLTPLCATFWPPCLLYLR